MKKGGRWGVVVRKNKVYDEKDRGLAEERGEGGERAVARICAGRLGVSAGVEKRKAPRSRDRARREDKCSRWRLRRGLREAPALRAPRHATERVAFN